MGYARQVSRRSKGTRGRVVLVVLVYSLFFLSGISGLVYQIVWARQLGLVFGNTDYAVATTLSVFMLGLGLGGLAIGAWADRKLRTLRGLLIAYCAIELVIGILGVFTVWGIPRLDALSGAISTYTTSPSAGGLFHLSPSTNVWRLLVSFSLLFPPTFLMGGTLPLLSKLVSAAGASVGRAIGYLFMFNTLGAAVGCFWTDFAAIRLFGVLGTGVFAASLNAAVASLGWASLWRRSKAVREMACGPPRLAIPRPTGWRSDAGLFRWAAAAFAVSGFCGMALEVIWFRVLGSYLLGYRAVLSSILTVVLLGLVAGTWASTRLISGKRSPLFLFATSQIALGCAALATVFFTNSVDYFAAVDWILARFASDAGRYHAGYLFCLGMVFLVVALPAFFMGWSFPLVNAFCQRHFDTVGREVGRLYLFNTLGAVLGSLLQGFVLTPLVGIQNSLLLACALAIGSGLLLLWRQAESATLKPALLAPVAVAVLWWTLPADFLMDRYSFHTERDDRVIYRHEGRNESILVLEDGTGTVRSLNTNGFSMSDTSLPAQRYMRLMAHLPLLMQERPERALVICYGVGNTTHAVAQHESLERIDVVDLSEETLAISRYFEATNGGVLEDPRVRAYVNDGRHHLIMHEGRYDLVTSEPPPLPFAYTVNLYTRDHYELVRNRLSDRGFFTQWLPVSQLDREVNRQAIQAFIDVFPHSILISGYRNNLILMGSPSPITLDVEAWRRRIEASAALEADLERIAASDVTELAGSFVMGERALARYTSDVAPVTDDRPVMEYSKSLHYLSEQDARLYHDLAGVDRYLVGPKPAALPDYLALMGVLYHEPAYLGNTDTWMKRETVERARHHYRNLLARGYRSGYLEHFLGAGLVRELSR